MFSKGDLFFLNQEGRDLFHHIQAENGIIMSGPYLIYELDCHRTPDTIQYYAYDILINGRLFNKMPEKFLERVTEDEENTQ